MKKLKKLKVEVTPDDIAYGHKGDGAHCPIARACKRLGFYPNAMPGHMSLTCIETHEIWQALTPSVASAFMSDFDSGFSVIPFTFEIEAVNMTATEDPATEEVQEALAKAKALEAKNEA